MKWAVRLQNDREFFRLAVAEIANPPEPNRNLSRIDRVDCRDTDALPQIFIRVRIGIFDEYHGVVVRIWIEAPLAHDLVSARSSRARIDGKSQVFGDGRRLESPSQCTANKQADRQQGDRA